MSRVERLSSRSFRDSGVRTFGFGDLHKGRMALEGFDYLASTGADGARAAIVPAWDGERYRIPAQQLTDLRWMMGECQKRKLHLFPVLATASDNEHATLWRSRSALASLVECAETVIGVMRGRTVAGGFDILNEPRHFLPGDDDVYWRGYVAPVVEAAARIDPKRVLFVEPWPGARVDTQPEWGDYWRPQPENVVMSPHMYSPFAYTHKGMGWVGEGQAFDPLTTLRQMHSELVYARNVAREFDVPVWLGEASSRQDEPGAPEWAQHLIELCRGFGFSMNWHYLFGAPAWHPNEATMRVLDAWFKKR